jgi:hypothetical protein
MFLEYLNALRDELSAKHPDLRQCELHPGDLGEHEIKSIAPHCPAILISLGLVKPFEDMGDNTRNYPLVPVIYIITRDEPGLTRFEVAVTLVQSVLEIVHDNHFKVKGVSAPTELSAKNLFTGQVDREQVSLWAIRFTQKLRVGTSLIDDSGVLPKDLYIGISPEIGQKHEDDYVQVDSLQVEPVQVTGGNNVSI